MLQVGNRTIQIDHVIVSNYGIFVIKTKNYKAWIVIMILMIIGSR
ncbi:MAG TPA: nuclease-related domain-containing protein [Clostridium sp.]